MGLALLVGAGYLLYKKHIEVYIPLSILMTTFLVILVFGQGQDSVTHLMLGALILGALFMATDWTTSPVTIPAQILYGVGIGVFVGFIRLLGIKPEGIAIGILYMNVAFFFLDQLFLPKKF